MKRLLSWSLCAALPAFGLILLASTVQGGAAAPAAAAEPPGTAVVLEIDGAIGPATSRYVVRGLEAAQKAGGRVVVLQLDTPGGLDSAMRDIIRAIPAKRNRLAKTSGISPESPGRGPAKFLAPPKRRTPCPHRSASLR